MKALLLKDALVLHSQLKRIGIFVLIFILISGMGMSTFIFVLAALLPINAMSYDERSKWGELSAMMPFSAKQIVISKYVLSYLLTFGIGGVGIGLIAVREVAFGTMLDVSELAIYAALGTIVALVSNAVYIPPVLQFGTEKARILLFVFLFAATFAITWFSNVFMSMSALLEQHIFVILAVLAVVAVLLQFVSVTISLRIYYKKMAK